MADGTDATEIFVNGWAAYEKLLKNDYLRHKVLYGGLAERLKGFKTGEKFALLDMGCGDAHYIAEALERSGAGQRLTKYTGVDLTGDALKLAQQNVAAATAGGGCQVDLQQANMLDWSEGPGEREFDAAMTSFAAHHLRTDEKEKFVNGIGRRLKPGGVFFVVDHFRRSGEELRPYLERFCQYATETWTELTPAELKHFLDHIRAYDIPESADKYQEFATKAGFGPAKEIAADSDFLKVLAFMKEE